MVKRYPEYRSVPFSPISTLSPACPSLDAAAHNFSSFYFQEAIRPVLKSSDRALCHEHTSSLAETSPDKKYFVSLNCTVPTVCSAIFGPSPRAIWTNTGSDRIWTWGLVQPTELCVKSRLSTPQLLCGTYLRPGRVLAQR